MKRLLFIKYLVVLYDQVLSRKIFIERAIYYFDNRDEHKLDETLSVVMDLLNTVEVFNIIDDVRNMIERGHIFLKTVWKKRV